MKPLTTALAGLVFLFTLAHLAQAESACPAKVAVEQKASAPTSDWAVTYSGYETAISGVTIFEGPPAEQASLVPDNQKTAGDKVIQTWRLPKSDRGYWLQCNYANTTAQISRRLPASVERCDVVYDHNLHFADGGDVVKSVNCK